jgi:hypothetical protein
MIRIRKSKATSQGCAACANNIDSTMGMVLCSVTKQYNQIKFVCKNRYDEFVEDIYRSSKKYKEDRKKFDKKRREKKKIMAIEEVKKTLPKILLQFPDGIVSPLDIQQFYPELDVRKLAAKLKVFCVNKLAKKIGDRKYRLICPQG